MKHQEVMQMKDNLYHFFGCESKEELYKKVKEDDLSVRSLVDFMEYSKMDMTLQDRGITSPENFVESISNLAMPEREEIIGVFVNTKNIPVHLSRMDAYNRKSYALGLKEALNAGAVNMFVVGSDHINELDATNYFETFGLEVMDRFSYLSTYNEIRSHRENHSYELSKFTKTNDYHYVSETIQNEAYKDSNEYLPTLERFDEFSSYYSEQEIVGYQYDWQEAFGAIVCDKEGKILSVKEMFKGSPNASIVDKKVFAKELLRHNDVGYVSVYHNHPSGILIQVLKICK